MINIRSLFCLHDDEFIRNIHGDEIIIYNGDRSMWKCKKCGRVASKPKYMDDKKSKEKTIDWYMHFILHADI